MDKKTNVTISISNTLLEQIKQDSNRGTKSTNAWINELLTNYYTFYKHYEALEGVGVPSTIFKEMIETVEEKQMMKWLRQANNEIWPSVMVRDNIPTDIEHFAEYSFGNVARRAGLFSMFRHHTNNEGHLCLVFEHKFGIKWSKMISEVFSESLVNLFRIEVHSKITQNTVVITVLEKDLAKVKLKL